MSLHCDVHFVLPLPLTTSFIFFKLGRELCQRKSCDYQAERYFEGSWLVVGALFSTVLSVVGNRLYRPISESSLESASRGSTGNRNEFGRVERERTDREGIVCFLFFLPAFIGFKKLSQI